MLTTVLLALLALRPALTPIEFAHSPEWLVARSKPETTLMGISVNGHSLADVEQRFGHPARVDRNPEYPNEAIYHWEVGKITLDVATMFPAGTTSKAGQHVYSIAVSAPDPNPRAKTGAGVALGDSFGKLIARYGNRYHTGYRKDFSANAVTVLFVFSDDTELAAGVDDDGRITALQLTASSD